MGHSPNSVLFMYSLLFSLYRVSHLTSPHLTCPLRGHLLQLALSAATRLASLQQFHPSIRLSFSTVDRHVVFG